MIVISPGGAPPASLGGPGCGRSPGKGFPLCLDTDPHYQRCTPTPALPVNIKKFLYSDGLAIGVYSTLMLYSTKTSPNRTPLNQILVQSDTSRDLTNSG